MTKEKFLSYEEVRKSGRTNMFDVNTVLALSSEELTKDDCINIMKNYSKYSKKWLDN